MAAPTRANIAIARFTPPGGFTLPGMVEVKTSPWGKFGGVNLNADKMRRRVWKAFTSISQKVICLGWNALPPPQVRLYNIMMKNLLDSGVRILTRLYNMEAAYANLMVVHWRFERDYMVQIQDERTTRHSHTAWQAGQERNESFWHHCCTRVFH